MLTPLPVFIEGQHRDTAGLKDFVELRTNGPDFYKVSPTTYDVNIVVSLLSQSLMDDTNYHRLYESLGVMQGAFISISVYKFGTGYDDDQTYLGCLTLVDPLITKHLGQVAARTNLVQGVVQGTYKMSLTD